VKFQSLDYAIFLLALLSVYWRLPRRPQNALLLGASYLFYGWIHPWFLALIGASTLVDYGCGLGIERAPARRRLLLGVSLACNLGLLGTFKYLGFFADAAAAALATLGLPTFETALRVVLPVGISFYTFQTLGYTIDVYRGRVAARRNLLDYALYVSLFPQLVAGPIERAGELLPQVERPRALAPEALRSAALLLAWGFFKKLVVADSVAAVPDRVFALQDPGFALLWVGVLGFCVQIYADFSAYTDIARGSARLLGFELMQNFAHPYLSQTPAQFWRRWHISLSTWFRDYVYIPLGGNRSGPARRAWNVFLTLVLAGLWHGASWNFALWGAYHAALLLAYRAVGRVAPGLLAARAGALPRWIVFFAATNVGWLFFRETRIAWIARDLAARPGDDSPAQLAAAAFLFVAVVTWALPLAVDSALAATGALARLRGHPRAALLQHLLLVVLVAATIALHSPEGRDFVYFRF